jgi:type IV pilus assembly protein PilQ
MMRRLALATILPLVLAAAPAFADNSVRVTGLRLEPNGAQTELTVQLDGSASSWDDFTMRDPARIVIDVAGARNALPSDRFERINRGGIAGVRVSQFSPDVVRIVVDLERHARYSVSAAPDGIRLSLTSNGGRFDAWSAGGPGTGSSRSASNQPAPAARAVAHNPTERRITVTFYDADIRDVLASFAEFTGRSIVPGSGVTGAVTAEIRNQPWDVALETILSSHGLAAREMPSGIIRVDALERLREREVQEPLITETHRINYVPVQELVTTMQSLATQRGSIVANPSTNMLIVTDVESAVNNIRSMVRQLDIQTPQVAIQAKIIFVNRSSVEELGVTYDLKDRPLNDPPGNAFNRLVQLPDPRNPGEYLNPETNVVQLGGSSIAALGNANARVTGPSLETIMSLVIGRFTLVAFLDALQRSELSDVQAAPLITTLDNQEAEIWVGERTPIRVVDTGTGGAGATGPRATAQLVETGIRLRVTPTITGDRRVLLQLHAERSSAVPAAGEIGVVFQTQQGSTRLMVNDGETAVIGGLTVTETFTRRTGIPVLMDIPVLGALFRTTQSQEQKRDLLIMVTPHIVEERA